MMQTDVLRLRGTKRVVRLTDVPPTSVDAFDQSSAGCHTITNNANNCSPAVHATCLQKLLQIPCKREQTLCNIKLKRVTKLAFYGIG
eukprot:3841318-Amphidinium_carterae.1